jgi:hypothetical protein
MLDPVGASEAHVASANGNPWPPGDRGTPPRQARNGVLQRRATSATPEGDDHGHRDDHPTDR